MSASVSLTFPDGSIRQYDAGTTGVAVAESISKSLAKKAVAYAIDGGERSRSSSSRSLLLAARPGALIRVQRPKIKVYCCVAVSAYRMSSCHFVFLRKWGVLLGVPPWLPNFLGKKYSCHVGSKRVLSGGLLSLSERIA